MTTETPHLLDEIELDIFADVFQFSISDGRGFTCQPSPAWVNNLMHPQLLAVTHGVLAVGTVRDMDVPVRVERWDRDPADGLEPFDHVTEAAIEVNSGTLVIMGPIDHPAEAATLTVPPDSYHARVYYGGLDDLSDDGLDGNDRYRVALWPGPHRPIRVIKQHR